MKHLPRFAALFALVSACLIALPGAAFAAEDWDAAVWDVDPAAMAEAAAAAEGHAADEPADDGLSLLATTVRSISYTLREFAQMYYDEGDYDYGDTLQDMVDALDPGQNSRTQFADLHSGTRMTAAQIDAFIDTNGADGKLHGLGATFVSAAAACNINPTYLLANAIVESGWGKSRLASGTYYDGKTAVQGQTYPAGTYYNFFGIGAVDGSAFSSGLNMAIREGWSSPAKAVEGAAQWISNGYINRTRDKYAQPTLYLMRWDYERTLDDGEPGWHRYASSIDWATTIARVMDQAYAHAGVTPGFDYIVPQYKASTGSTPSVNPPVAQTFSDVAPSHWAFNVIEACAASGIMNGTDGKFNPEATLTRAQAATVLYNYYVGEPAKANMPTANVTGCSDVKAGAWYIKPVNWAVRMRLMSGSDGKFRPDDPISRQELCCVMANASRIFTGAGIDGSGVARLNAMSDAASVADWARASVAWCLNNSVLNGKPSGDDVRICPKDPVKRSEMAAIVQNAIAAQVL